MNIDRFLVQTAVYWEPSGRDAYGQPLYSSPIEVSCRWSYLVNTEVFGQGEQQVANIQVFLTDRVLVNGLLYRGTLEEVMELQFPSDPRQAGAVEIAQVQEAFDHKGRLIFYVARCLTR